VAHLYRKLYFSFIYATRERANFLFALPMYMSEAGACTCSRACSTESSVISRLTPIKWSSSIPPATSMKTWVAHMDGEGNFAAAINPFFGSRTHA
jgi:hypothetical protein